MKNFKVIKESWDRFVNEQEEELPFMAIKAPIKGKIDEINKEVDNLISGGAIFFDTETMGLDAVKPVYGATSAGDKPSTLQEAPKDPGRKAPAPLTLNTTTRGVKGQMLTEIAAAYATGDEILSGVFPESERSHSRITIEDANRKEISDFAKKYYKEGTIEFDLDKYFGAVKNKIKFAMKKKELFDKAKGSESEEVFDKVTPEQLNSAVMNPEMLAFYGVFPLTKGEPTDEQARQYFDELVKDSVSSIKTPHQLLLMTAYFGSEEEVMGKIKSGEIRMEDFINLNPEVMKQPTDTDSVSEEEAIKRFYDYANSHKGIPLIAQNAGFDKGFISKRAGIYGLGDFDQLGLKDIRDTLKLFSSFRNYLNEIIAMGEDAKKQIKEEITKISGGNTPQEIIAILTTAKGRPTVSQGPMAAALKVEATRWHTAIADIEILFKIFSSVIRILKAIESLDSDASLSDTAARKKSVKEDIGKFATAPQELPKGLTSPQELPKGATEPQQFDKMSSTQSPQITQAIELAEYLNGVIANAKEAIERINVFDMAIKTGGSTGPLLESKKVSKKPIRENKAITIRIGKW